MEIPPGIPSRCTEVGTVVNGVHTVKKAYESRHSGYVVITDNQIVLGASLYAFALAAYLLAPPAIRVHLDSSAMSVATSRLVGGYCTTFNWLGSSIRVGSGSGS
jgi:hypothetical protein